MAHFAILAPPDAGHLYPLGAIGIELVRRGHEVTVISRPKAAPLVEQLQLGFRRLDTEQIPGASDFLLWLLFSVAGTGWKIGFRNSYVHSAEAVLQLVPPILKELALDGLIVDQVMAAGGTAAERVGLPFATVCPALPWNEDPAQPPPFTLWPYEEGLRARLRNRWGYAGWRWFIAPTLRVINRYRRAWGLRRFAWMDDSYSSLAQISQLFPAVRFSPQYDARLLSLRGFVGRRTAVQLGRISLGPARWTALGLRLVGHRCRSHESAGIPQDCRRLRRASGAIGVGPREMGRGRGRT